MTESTENPWNKFLLAGLLRYVGEAAWVLFIASVIGNVLYNFAVNFATHPTYNKLFVGAVLLSFVVWFASLSAFAYLSHIAPDLNED